MKIKYEVMYLIVLESKQMKTPQKYEDLWHLMYFSIIIIKILI